MSVIVSDAGNFGPFKTIVLIDDYLLADDINKYFLSVIGNYTVNEDDNLAPQVARANIAARSANHSEGKTNRPPAADVVRTGTMRARWMSLLGLAPKQSG
jgi:hypothetical protein